MPNQAPDLGLEFDGEMLVAQTNLIAYRKIYGLETWLRRICLAAWMARFGEKWSQKIDPRLRTILERRVRQNRQRLYLGAESHDDLMWQATHGELLQMLVANEIADSIRAITGTDASFLQGKLQEIREIRNLLAHNRALSERTHIILSGLLAALAETVDTFKARVLYGPYDILDDHDGWIGSRLAARLRNNDWSQFQAFAAKQENFLQYVCLPAGFESHHGWPDARLLLNAFSDQLEGIVAFCLNKQGYEFIILTPLTLPTDSQNILCDTFARNPNVWTKSEFEAQQPRYICSPKIWFYENGSPPSGV